MSAASTTTAWTESPRPDSDLWALHECMDHGFGKSAIPALLALLRAYHLEFRDRLCKEIGIL